MNFDSLDTFMSIMKELNHDIIIIPSEYVPVKEDYYMSPPTDKFYYKCKKCSSIFLLYKDGMGYRLVLTNAMLHFSENTRLRILNCEEMVIKSII